VSVYYLEHFNFLIPSLVIFIWKEVEMKEVKDRRVPVARKYIQSKSNIKCLEKRLKVLRKRKIELQKVREKLADTVF
jgi:hypothetical protein